MNTRLQLYDHLQQFSLFQGMSRAELLQMAGNTRFGFQKMGAGRVVVREGDTCRQLQFLISGQLRLESQSDDHGYAVVEQLSAPWLIEPDALFGPSTRHTHTVTTLTEAHLITLSKDEVLRLLDDFLIFRLNLLNLYAASVRRHRHYAWRSVPNGLQARVVRFLLDHCVYPAGPKQFLILMKRLALELGDSRLHVSQVLNDLQRRGLLTLHRGRIDIDSIEHLLMQA